MASPHFAPKTQYWAADVISRKNKELEALSTKLSKYLSPQIYNSIFTGAQNVEIASSRKKLTIFFSDVVNFTETTDKLESEELTNLLNHYLTEMSGIALQYGATIDKYIGDAIMVFFGDPESKGVPEDSLVKDVVATEERSSIKVKGFAEAIHCYKVLGLYDDLVREGQVIREEQAGFKFMLDLQKRDKQQAIMTLETILARLRA